MRGLVTLCLLVAPATCLAQAHPRTELGSPARGLGEALDAPRAPAVPRPPRAPRAEAPAAAVLEAARACWDRGDNRCVIRALFGRRLDEPDLGRLVESLRARRDPRAYVAMAEHLARFPESEAAARYRRLLARSEGY